MQYCHRTFLNLFFDKACERNSIPLIYIGCGDSLTDHHALAPDPVAIRVIRVDSGAVAQVFGTLHIIVCKIRDAPSKGQRKGRRMYGVQTSNSTTT